MKPLWLSASGIKKWRMCERQWAFRYIARMREPGSAKTGFGSQVDSKIDNWIKNAKMPDNETMSGKAARALIQPGFLPDPSEGALTQDSFKVRLPTAFAVPVILNGFKDVSLQEKQLVVDVKTTGSKQYMLTEKNFPLDPQVAMYQWVAHKRWNVDRVMMRWIYVVLNWSKKDADGRQEVKSIKTTDKREQILDGNNKGIEQLFDDVADVAREYKRFMTEEAETEWQAAIQTASPTGLSTGGCDAFGGCHFSGQCTRTASDIFKAHERLVARSK